ncbi:hypothetical protein BJ165DRAFT_1447157 [Panaeolus papilionaceus]|nr:hypothetical protein BJ165DRAFT_1447157 [Panaeolus papilionaceus]
MWTRNTYSGCRRRLVVAFDVGTTCSGISYSILDPGQVPKVEGVTRFPNLEGDKIMPLSKVPSVLYYDTEGNLKGVGAEVMEDKFKEQASKEKWTKVEWFKLHLRPKKDDKDDTGSIPALPTNKSFEDVLADYLRYLNQCALRFIEHAHGAVMWESLVSTLSPSADDSGRYPAGQGTVYVLSHPNGWQGYQQQCYSKAACQAGLIPDEAESLHERLHFVTEGEASLHWASETLGASAAMKKGTGFTVIDAGGGTIDVSSYRRKKKESEERGIFEEIAAPSCYFQGSVFVTLRARTYLKQLLIDSEYYDNLDDILEAFDNTTKLRFRDPQEPQFVKFGGVGDNDHEVGIRFGQLKLKGEEVAALFKPAIDCIHDAVIEQRKLSNKTISHVILVGGFTNNDYLFECVRSALSSVSVKVCRVDNLPNKAVANGSVSYFLDHFVRTRLSKVAYGFFAPRPYDPKVRAHRKQFSRPEGHYKDEMGKTLVRNSFVKMLEKNDKVSEFRESRKSVYHLSDHEYKPKDRDIVMPIWTYSGKNTGARFWGDEPGSYAKAFTIVTNADHVPSYTVESDGEKYWKYDVDIILYFGLPSIRADLAWKEDGVEKRRPARLLYNAPWVSGLTADQWNCEAVGSGTITVDMEDPDETSP